MLNYVLLEPYVTIHRIVLESYDLFFGTKKKSYQPVGSMSPQAGRIVILCVDL